MKEQTVIFETSVTTSTESQEAAIKECQQYLKTVHPGREYKAVRIREGDIGPEKKIVHCHSKSEMRRLKLQTKDQKYLAYLKDH